MVWESLKPDWQFTEAGLDQDLERLKAEALVLSGEFRLSVLRHQLIHPTIAKEDQWVVT